MIYGGVLAPQAHADGPAFVSERLLVKPAKGLNEVDLHAFLSAEDAVEVNEVPRLGIRQIRVPAHALERVLAALKRNPRIEFAEKDYIAQAIGTANDPYYTAGNQWHISTIQAQAAWDVTTGSSGAVIAVLDSGANYSHPDLLGKLLPGYDFVNGDNDASDDNGHGTGVSGAAAAASNNGTGVASIAWDSPVLPLKVLDATGSGSHSNIARAINYAADSGARIINLSLGSTSNSSTLQSAVNYAWSKGAVIIAAAGNDGNDLPFYPAACQNVVAVSATNSSDLRPSWSNFGSYVDISAPGESILTTYHSDYAYVSGTSFSSPIAAATAALVASAEPKLSNVQVVDLLLKNSDDLGALGYDVIYGHGRLNAGRAVIAAKSVYPADSSAPAVTLNSPADGAVLSGTVQISASAVDNVGVSRMEILINGAVVSQGAVNNLAYSWATQQSAAGSYQVEVRAYDAAGNIGRSLTTVTVQQPVVVGDVTAPTVAIVSPQEGTVVSGTARIQVAAKDNVAVTEVWLYIDGQRFATSTSANAVFSWNTKKAARGAHKLQAYAYDAAGNVTASTLVTVYK